MNAHPTRPGKDTLVGRVAMVGEAVHIPDVLGDPDYDYGVGPQIGDYRAMFGAPLIRNGHVDGVFGLMRPEAWRLHAASEGYRAGFRRPGCDRHRERPVVCGGAGQDPGPRGVLAQQTATADVLKVISRSAFDLETVTTTILQSAMDLCRAPTGLLHLRDGEVFRLKLTLGHSPTLDEFNRQNPIQLRDALHARRPARPGDYGHYSDMWNDPDYRFKNAVKLADVRSGIVMPMFREEEVIGLFSLARREAGGFTPSQIKLVQTFADQAAIAIENVRLFDEVKTKTDDLTEALQQQTATADVLKVISRSAFDLQTVLDTLIRSAVELVGCRFGTIHLRDGAVYPLEATHGIAPELARHLRKRPFRPGRESIVGRVAVSGAVEFISDVLEDAEFLLPVNALGEIRSVLGVPLLRNDRVEGVVVLSRREPGLFSERQVDLVRTFADQALIAIENVRLFDEVQAKTRDLEESLTHQIATSGVLQAIGGSMADAQPVFERIVDSLARLMPHSLIGVWLTPGDGLMHVAAFRGSKAYHFEGIFPAPVGQTAMAHAPDAEQQIYFADVLGVPGTPPTMRAIAEGFGNFAVLITRMFWKGQLIGTLGVTREPGSTFTERERKLLCTFADQAVIAIENARLFGEVQARTRDLTEALQMQTATSDVLKVISRSAFDLQSVFNTLVTSAVELGGALTGTICVRDGEVFRYRDTIGAEHTSALAQYLRDHPAAPGRSTIAGRVLLSGKVERIPDCLADPEYVVPMGSLTSNVRSLLGVPLLRKEGVEGAIILTRAEPGHFSDRQIEIVQTFADQAVIALENVRLFDEVQARTKELAASLDDLRKAQDRLIQSEKLASLGQLTAGIAHEIKNPLNFINNFSALSRELMDELREALAKSPLGDAGRDEAGELIGMIDANLDKIVTHGKRADSIVKNMLLHSREGSGERTFVDVNAMVEEALNLAYHGARAEKNDFNVSIEKSLDPRAGMADIYAQEITRVLLNLISNGFYATKKRKQAMGNGKYEPTIYAATRDLGRSVEIVIRDNGTGIPEDVKAKMFNPFFTTKPAGEGTGLGLSLSHDIVVKQHGGTIEAATEPGAYTQFTVTLPRAGASA